MSFASSLEGQPIPARSGHTQGIPGIPAGERIHMLCFRQAPRKLLFRQTAQRGTSRGSRPALCGHGGSLGAGTVTGTVHLPGRRQSAERIAALTT